VSDLNNMYINIQRLLSSSLLSKTTKNQDYDDKINKGEVGGTRSTYGGDE
jgi:hypothetical protein